MSKVISALVAKRQQIEEAQLEAIKDLVHEILTNPIIISIGGVAITGRLHNAYYRTQARKEDGSPSSTKETIWIPEKTTTKTIAYYNRWEWHPGSDYWNLAFNDTGLSEEEVFLKYPPQEPKGAFQYFEEYYAVDPSTGGLYFRVMYRLIRGSGGYWSWVPFFKVPDITRPGEYDPEPLTKPSETQAKSPDFILSVGPLYFQQITYQTFGHYETIDIPQWQYHRVIDSPYSEILASSFSAEAVIAAVSQSGGLDFLKSILGK